MTKQKHDKAPTPEVTSDSDESLLDLIRLDQSLSDDLLGVKRALHVVPVKKPSKTDFFRCHPAHFFDTYLIELKDEGENYFAAPQVLQLLASFARPARLRYCVTRQGVHFLWPLKIPRDDRRRDSWARSAMEAAREAETKWVRLEANKHGGFYECFEAVGNLGEPQWREQPWETVLETAVRDCIIKTADDPIVRHLLGHS